ncbi:hypothetical protein QF034_007764 [Streptomyces africanus]|uniref:DUF2255 family protein n=1 Tax=Streptomyces africanus TaxID=231024 RepID=A0ABU0R1J8_9ACTN|nr:DUF2255 family protein [Streptomyces africanus]MDQ0753533.1 hypothetical protein [Streptomyces africanus]
MTHWTSDQLNTIEQTGELHIQPQRADGRLRTPTTIWVVREGDDLYVRSYNGPDGAWFRTAKASGTGHIRCGGIDQDVTLTPIHDGALNDRIDGAYRTKYAAASAYVPPMVADRARATTLKLTPR